MRKSILYYPNSTIACSGYQGASAIDLHLYSFVIAQLGASIKIDFVPREKRLRGLQANYFIL